MIRITSKREGFRRCGIAHSRKPVDYDDKRFSKKVLAILLAESMLTVEVLLDKEEDIRKAEAEAKAKAEADAKAKAEAEAKAKAEKNKGKTDKDKA